MSKNYVYQKDGTWKCVKCGKIVKEFGWQGHNRKHKRLNTVKETQRHIDTCLMYEELKIHASLQGVTPDNSPKKAPQSEEGQSGI